MDKLTTELKDLRYTCSITADLLESMVGTKEIALAKTKAEEAMMWTGECFKILPNSKNPYPNSMDPTNNKIEPKSDVSKTSTIFTEEVLKEFEGYTGIQLIKALRGKLEDVLSNLLALNIPSDKQEIIMPLAYNLQIINMKLRECKHWLGMELARIKKEEK